MRTRHFKPVRYTVDQVLRGIQSFVTENCGPAVVVEADRPLIVYEQAARESHECPLWFLADLAKYFGLRWDERRWVVWLKLRGDKSLTKRERKAAWARWQSKVAPCFTVRVLAERIARSAPAPSMEPVTVLGATCAKAGVFLAVCDMPELAGRRVAPSTPLRALGSAERIAKLWRRVEWVSGVSLPATTPPSASRVADWLTEATWGSSFFAALATGIALASLGHLILAGFAAFGTWIVVLEAGHFAVDRIHNPLPAGVVSFGDLARLVENRRSSSRA